jgi:hypothetical protein
MDTLVLLGVPADQGVLVLLFGADVVGEIGEGTGGVAGDGAGGGAADAGVAGLRNVVAQEGVFGGEQGAGRCGPLADGGVGAGVGDVEEGFGLAVDMARAAGEDTFDCHREVRGTRGQDVATSEVDSVL